MISALFDKIATIVKLDKDDCRDANINVQKIGRIQTKIREVSKSHATSMAQNLPEIGRLPNLGVKLGPKCLQNREPPY